MFFPPGWLILLIGVVVLIVLVVLVAVGVLEPMEGHNPPQGFLGLR